MSITVQKKLDAVTHSEIVTLTDSLGAQMVLTLPLVHTVEVAPGEHEFQKADLDSEIEKAKKLMEARERVVLEHAQERGHALPETVQAKDCGCPAGTKSPGAV